MNSLDGQLHRKVVSYVIAEHEQSSDRAVGRLLTVLKNGNLKLGESAFWLLVEMVGRKIVGLHEKEGIAPELVQTITYEVLMCIVARAKELGVTGLGQQKLLSFLKDMSAIRYATPMPLQLPFDNQESNLRDGEPFAQLSEPVRTAIAHYRSEMFHYKFITANRSFLVFFKTQLCGLGI